MSFGKDSNAKFLTAKDKNVRFAMKIQRHFTLMYGPICSNLLQRKRSARMVAYHATGAPLSTSSLHYRQRVVRAVSLVGVAMPGEVSSLVIISGTKLSIDLYRKD
jgi:hypothetical protein